MRNRERERERERGTMRRRKRFLDGIQVENLAREILYF